MIPPDLLLRAYASGWFPMAQAAGADAAIEWFSPDPRAVIPLDAFHVPARLARTARRRPYDLVIDHDFEGVMRACAERDETWINEPLLQSYVELHRRGFAHSVEARREGRLAGGLYGVSLRGAFFGESMFHTETDASKLALVALVERLRARDRMHHALLIAGPAGLGKKALALHYAQALLCESPRDDGLACGACAGCGYAAARTHPDLRVLDLWDFDDKDEAWAPAGEIRIARVRSLSRMKLAVDELRTRAMTLLAIAGVAWASNTMHPSSPTMTAVLGSPSAVKA